MDVLIYDTMFGDITEVRNALETFRKPKKEIEGQKVLILVSSIRSWSETEKKIKIVVEAAKADSEGEDKGSQAEGEGDDEDKGSQAEGEGDGEKPKEDGDSPDLENAENRDEDAKTEYDAEGNALPKPEKAEIVESESEEVPPEFDAWNDEDYVQRIPSAQYQLIKDLEDEVINLNVEQVKTYVICGGLIYGNGENAFYELVKASWRQEPVRLPFYGSGENLVPTIHVKDLVRFSLKISEMMPESKPYHFAFDNTEDRSLKSIIEDLSTSIGSGGIESISGETDLIPKDYQDMFQANLWANTSSFLKPPEQIDGEEAAPADFEWHAEKGIHGCSDKILSEFVTMHSLKPIKIVLIGHKDSGKTHFSSLLGQHYKIPVLCIKKIFSDFPPAPINPKPVDADGNTVEDDFELAADYKDLKEEVDQVLQKVLNGESNVTFALFK